jgi:hypothetical protein
MSVLIDQRRPAPSASLAAIAAACLTISLFGFGGGIVWARRIAVERRRWLSEAEFLDIVSLAQFMPGPNVLGIAVCTGTRLRGVAGAAPRIKPGAGDQLRRFHFNSSRSPAAPPGIATGVGCQSDGLSGRRCRSLIPINAASGSRGHRDASAGIPPAARRDFGKRRHDGGNRHPDHEPRARHRNRDRSRHTGPQIALLDAAL